MKIQVNTDNHINGHEKLAQSVESTLNYILARFEGQVTRLEVHLSDESSASKSSANDKRCLLEARLAGREPTTVSDHADTIELAVQGAAHKMVHLLDHELGKLSSH